MKRRILPGVLALVLLVGVLLPSAWSVCAEDTYRAAWREIVAHNISTYYKNYENDLPKPYIDDTKQLCFRIYNKTTKYEYVDTDYFEADLWLAESPAVRVELTIPYGKSETIQARACAGKTRVGYIRLAPATYNCQYISFYSYEGEIPLKRDLEIFANEKIPLILELIRADMHESGYDLRDLGFTSFNRHTYHFYDELDDVMIKEATCISGTIWERPCLYKDCDYVKIIESAPNKTAHHLKLVEVEREPTKDKPHSGQAFFQCVLCGYRCGSETCAKTVFKDMPMDENYAHEAIDWAYFHQPQITNGETYRKFGGTTTCTRAHVVTFLWRAMGKPKPVTTENPFTDVKPTDYFYQAVLWAVEQGITKGTSAATFGPNDGCTREQVVTFLWRAKGRPKPASRELPFTDVGENSFARKAILWAVEEGITNGSSKTTFSPYDTCIRYEIVTFLYRALGD